MALLTAFWIVRISYDHNVRKNMVVKIVIRLKLLAYTEDTLVVAINVLVVCKCFLWKKIQYAFHHQVWKNFTMRMLFKFCMKHLPRKIDVQFLKISFFCNCISVVYELINKQLHQNIQLTKKKCNFIYSRMMDRLLSTAREQYLFYLV